MFRANESALPSRLRAAAGIALLVAAPPAQNLVADLVAPTPSAIGSTPRDIVDLNGVAVFAAQTGHGRELWRSDGTPGGTYPLKDIQPGPNGSNPTGLTVAGNYVFFVATVAGIGAELWRTDGTAAGTILLIDLIPGPGGGGPNALVAYGPHVYFTASDSTNGSELWRSDGTVAGTGLFADLLPGAGSGAPTLLTVSLGRLFFFGSAPGAGRELWSSDGTVAGTQLLVDLVPGASGSTPTRMVGIDSGVVFAGTIGSTFGAEVWFSDGTAAGTVLLADVQPGPTGSSPINLTSVGEAAMWSANDGVTGNEPWWTDGTPGGTVSLGDLEPGLVSSSATQFTRVGPGVAVFSAQTTTHGSELWATDGTAAGTTALDFVPGVGGLYPGDLIATPGGAFFAGSQQATGRELWTTDGTLAGTVLVADIAPGTTSSSPSELAWVGGQLLLSGRPSSSVGVELVISDGTAAGTGLVTDIYLPQGDSLPRQFRSSPNGVVFAANVVGGSSELYVSDGSISGTVQLDFAPGAAFPDHLVEFGGLVYASGQTPVGRELIATDGTLAGTGLAVDVIPGAASSGLANLTAAAGRLWFQGVSPGSGIEGYASDGTAAGTVVLGDLWPGAPSSSPSQFTAVGSLVVFSANTPSGQMPWVSDGTAAGTSQLAPALSLSQPANFLSAGSVAYFAATQSGVTGRELWVTDGTTAGTTLVADIAVGFGSSNPGRPVLLANGTVVFVAVVAGVQRLFRTDGTPAGTIALPQLAGASNPQIQDLVALGNQAFFTAVDTAHGRELWVTDGVSASMVADVYVGPPDGVLAGTLAARSAQGQLVFAGSDGSEGLQIWLSDGTALGTTQVGKIGPWAGVGAVQLGDFTAIGSDVWFVCDEGITGVEPWLISINGPVAAVAPYGSGCAPMGSAVPQIAGVGLPTIGNGGFAIAVSNGVPSSLAVLMAGFAPTAIPLGPCTGLIAPPIVTLPTVFLDGVGAGATALPIPNDPGLAGALLYGQYLVLAPNGPFLGFASLSGGLSMQLGN